LYGSVESASFFDMVPLNNGLLQHATRLILEYTLANMVHDLAQFEIREAAPGKGFGLYARRDFELGEHVLDYTGKKITTEYADSLGTRYLFELDDQWTIDGEDESNTARYINHSCDPNVEAEIDEDEIKIYTLRDIETGEEFTIDYGDEYFDEFIRPVGCLCRSAVCRKPAIEADGTA
jgi:uncharacterized protein